MIMRARTARLLGLVAALAAGAIALTGATSAGAAGAGRVACPDQFQSTIYHGSDTVTFCNYASYDAATHQVRAVGEIGTAAGFAKTSMSELDVSFFDDFGTTSYLVERAVFRPATHFGRTAPSNCLPAEWYAVTIKYSIRWSDGSTTHDEYPVFYNPGAACR
jgi:hypothetical protein